MGVDEEPPMHEGGAAEAGAAEAEEDEGRPLLTGEAATPKTPVPHGSHSRHATTFQASMNLFKGMIGAGVLGLPAAFRAAGWLAALAILVVVALVSIYACQLLLEAKSVAEVELRRRGEKEEDEEITYPDVGAAAVPTAGLGRSLTFFFLVATQIGSCIAYVMFIGNNLHALDLGAPRWALILMLAPLLFAFTLSRDMASIYPVSLGGTILFVVGVVVVVAEAVDSWNPPAQFPAVRTEGLARFTGTAIFALSGINLVIPVEESLRHSSHFLPLLYMVFASLLALYYLFGMFFWAMLGDGVPAELTVAFPATFGGYFARACLCVYIFATYIVNMFPVSELYDQWAHHRLPPGVRGAVGHPWVIRALLVGSTCAAAAAVEDFGPFLALVGYVGFGFQGLIAPAVFHLALAPPEKQTVLDRLGCAALLVGGLVVAVWGTYSSVADM